MGAALATLAALDIIDKYKIDIFYIFGTPRVGNY